MLARLSVSLDHSFSVSVGMGKRFTSQVISVKLPISRHLSLDLEESF